MEENQTNGGEQKVKVPSRLSVLVKNVKEPKASEARKSELLSIWADKRDIVDALEAKLQAAKEDEQKAIDVIATTIGAGPWRFDNKLIGLSGREQSIYMRVWGNEDVEQVARVKPGASAQSPHKK